VRPDEGWELPSGYNFHTYEQWFRDFTQKYLQGAEFDVANVQLKIDHTLRVLAFARRLTSALAPDPGLGELAHLAALFHDVGRFPQYARYRTFHDKMSVNHACQGVLTLKQHQVLAGLAPSAGKLVLGAVALHNRRFLPRGLPPEVRYLTQIVRDADKLDIFAVMLAHFDPGAPHNKVVNLELKPHPDNYTPEILDKVLKRQMVNYQDMVWVNDFKLLLCSWVYDLNYGVSRAVVRERGYLEELAGYLPRSPEFAQLGQQLREDLAAGG
jgi:HD superfamily phosphodiesterase